MTPKHFDYLEHMGIEGTIDGQTVDIFKLQLIEDETILVEWAKQFRQNYCTDDEIEIQRSGTGMTQDEYLREIKFPDRVKSPGPSTRAGDFSEILIADYVEYVLNYYVPRTRYDRKINRNSSPMGSDLIAFKMGEDVSPSDEMLVFEVKAQASNTLPKNRLQDAIDDSNKDMKKLGVSLNAAKQRLIDRGDTNEAAIIQRFQNKTDRSYRLLFGAAAVHSEHSYSKELIESATTIDHISDDIMLIVIYSANLMDTIHELYERACQC